MSGSERTRPHTRSFSSVSRLREADSTSAASWLVGGGVGLLKVVRRGELSVEETRGLIAERAVAPLVMLGVCGWEDIDEERREDGVPATFGVADDILRYKAQLRAFPCKGPAFTRTVVACAYRSRAHPPSKAIIESSMMMMDSEYDFEQFQSESLDEVKFSFRITPRVAYPTSSY